ncbi:MAG: hypothetical protein AAF684_03840 [Pseudomonadota bacterium]
MTDRAIAAKIDDMLARLRAAEAQVEQDEAVDLSSLQADVATICARAERAPSDAMRDAMRALLDGIGALEDKMRARQSSVEGKLRSAPDRKRAVAAYGRP